LEFIGIYEGGFMMKKLIATILILSLVIIAPINYSTIPKVEAATTKYIVKADAEYTIMPDEKLLSMLKQPKQLHGVVRISL
jgi:hypothetical protein